LGGTRTFGGLGTRIEEESGAVGARPHLAAASAFVEWPSCGCGPGVQSFVNGRHPGGVLAEPLADFLAELATEPPAAGIVLDERSAAGLSCRSATGRSPR
jgi:hypothetical protein